MRISCILSTVVVALSTLSAQAEDFSVTAPGGHLTATVHFEEGQLSYSVSRDDRLIVRNSPLGLRTASANFTSGLTLVNTATAQVDDAYTLPTGKQSAYRDHCNVLAVFVSKDDWRLTVQFRLYDDGFAFRYVIPKFGNQTYTRVTEDAGRIRIADFKYCLACKFIGNLHSPNYPYEGTYSRYTWSQLTAATDNRMNAPALAYNGQEYLLLSEADNRGIFCSSLLMAEQPTGEFSYSLTGDTKNYGTLQEQKVSSLLPAYTPWRMVAVGDLATVFCTTMTENLCPPTTMRDTEWIRPGRAAWYWGGSDGNTTENRAEYGGLKEAEKAYVDLAAEMEWEYTTVDGGWQWEWVPEIVQYAREKGVKALLWQTADLKDNTSFSSSNMEGTLRKWAEAGIVGIKVDFWEDDSKTTMERMEQLLQVAAKYHMLVNFHGCTRPSGLRRTYPHLMTQEGIYGGEQNFWNHKNMSATHNLNLLFTRNVVGAADYTPGDVASHRGILLTNVSMAHHLALLTAFESGIVHVAESPGNLRYFLGRDIMKRIPVAWDETRLLEGSLQQYASIARRHGEDWWIAGLNVAARTARLKLDFLQEGKSYTAYIYRDGNCRTHMTFQKTTVTRTSLLNVPELQSGGFLIQISPDSNLPVPVIPDTYEAESPANTRSSGVTVNIYESLHASGGAQVNNLGLGRTLQFNQVRAEHAGTYLLTCYYSTVDDRRTQLLVNGQVVQDTVRFYGNGGFTNSYGSDGMSWKMIPVTLQEGNNSITIRAFTDSWAPNFDRITVQPMRSAEEETSLVSLPAARKLYTSAVYSLSGLPQRPAAKGIYIVDGKKFLY